jgi:restriction system protein
VVTLFLTTGVFSREARLEAQRDGAPPIDLVDGKAFAENLRNLRLGVKVKVVEEVTIDHDWFKDI